MLPDVYMQEFKEVLARKNLRPMTNKTLCSMVRRLGRALDENDMRDQAVLKMFRVPLARGSRAILGMTWNFLQETKVAADLPPLLRLPIVVYPHALSADITVLGAALGNERLTEATWGAACANWNWNERCLDAAGRVWWYFMPPDSIPTDNSALVVKDGHGRPMELWMIEYIINSPYYINKHKRTPREAVMVKFADKAISVAACMKVDSDFLKRMCERIELVREKHTKVDTFVLEKELDLILRTKNYARLAHIIDTLPIGSVTEAEEDAGIDEVQVSDFGAV